MKESIIVSCMHKSNRFLNHRPTTLLRESHSRWAMQLAGRIASQKTGQLLARCVRWAKIVQGVFIRHALTCSGLVARPAVAYCGFTGGLAVLRQPRVAALRQSATATGLSTHRPGLEWHRGAAPAAQLLSSVCKWTVAHWSICSKKFPP